MRPLREIKKCFVSFFPLTKLYRWAWRRSHIHFIRTLTIQSRAKYIFFFSGGTLGTEPTQNCACLWTYSFPIVPFLKSRERQNEREKNTQHLITSQCQHLHFSLLFPHDFSSFPHHPCALWQRKRDMVNRWEGGRQLFLKREPAHIFLVLLWFSLFAWICTLYSYFELNISNKKGCGLTCLIFPSLSCVIPPWPFSPSVVTPLPGFLLSVTLSQVCPEVHIGGGIFLALVSLSRSHPPHMLWLWISELAYHGREILLVVPLCLTISLSLA